MSDNGLADVPPAGGTLFGRSYMRGIFLLALCVLAACSPKTEEGQYVGKIIFLLAPVGGSETQDAAEVESDFNYVVESVAPYFAAHGIKYEVKSGPGPLTALNGEALAVKGGELPPVGYVLIKTSGESSYEPAWALTLM